MLFIISPSKSLDFNIANFSTNVSHPFFLEKSKILIEELRKYPIEKLSKLMNISDKLADLNFQRFQNFITPFNLKNAKPALFVFDGDVYDGINEVNYSEEELEFLQNNLRILSGLYGVLKPLDLMQPYRLEMGTNLKNYKSKNLYEFWKHDIANYFNQELANRNEQIIVNLASEEYFKVIDQKLFNGKFLNIIFKNNKNGVYKNIGFFSKKARGLMVDFIVKNKIKNIEDLRDFNLCGYRFDKAKSNEFNWCFYD